jgi:hypothetical protein
MIIYLLYIFIAFKLFIYFLLKINQNGTKIYYCKNYYYRRFNMENIINNKNKIIDDFKSISIATLGEVVNYKFLNNNFNNNVIMIVYDKNDKPVALNLVFNWKYENNNITHMGLYLVEKSSQKKGLQKVLGFVQIISAMLENNFNVYFTDIGRSATGFSAIDNSPILYNYPSVKYNVNDTQFKTLSKNIAESLYLNYSMDYCGVSKYSTYDKENMVIKESNKKEGGGLYILTESVETRKSRYEIYNNFVDTLCPNILDAFIIIAKPSFKKFFTNKK